MRRDIWIVCCERTRASALCVNWFLATARSVVDCRRWWCYSRCFCRRRHRRLGWNWFLFTRNDKPTMLSMCCKTICAAHHAAALQHRQAPKNARARENYFYKRILAILLQSDSMLAQIDQYTKVSQWAIANAIHITAADATSSISSIQRWMVGKRGMEKKHSTEMRLLDASHLSPNEKWSS